MTLAIAVGWMVGTMSPVEGKRRMVAAGVGALLVVEPMAGLAVALAVGLWTVRTNLASRRRSVAAIESDLVVLADLVSLGLTAGLPLRSALVAAAPHVHPVLQGELTALLDLADRRGLAAALADADGHVGRLARLAARAVVTGAPTAAAVESYAKERRHAEHTARLAEARKLPVRLLMPLALLILPGFVVLAVGPALLDALQRLGGLA